MKVVPIASTKNLGKTLLFVLLFASSLTGNILTSFSPSDRMKARLLSFSNETGFQDSAERKLFEVNEAFWKGMFENFRTEENGLPDISCSWDEGATTLTCGFNKDSLNWKVQIVNLSGAEPTNILFSFQNDTNNPVVIVKKELIPTKDSGKEKLRSKIVETVKGIIENDLTSLKFSVDKLEEFCTSHFANFEQVFKLNSFLMYRMKGNPLAELTIDQDKAYTVISFRAGSHSKVTKVLTKKVNEEGDTIFKHFAEKTKADQEKTNTEHEKTQQLLNETLLSSHLELDEQNEHFKKNSNENIFFYSWNPKNAGENSEKKSGEREVSQFSAIVLPLRSASLNFYFLQSESDFKKIEGYYENSDKGVEHLRKDVKDLSDEKVTVEESTQELDEEKVKKKIAEICPDAEILEGGSEFVHDFSKSQIKIVEKDGELTGSFSPLVNEANAESLMKAEPLNTEFSAKKFNNINDTPRIQAILRKWCPEKGGRILKKGTQNKLIDLSFDSPVEENQDAGVFVKIEALKHVTFDE